jgi:ribosome-associated translation inhibitor RaiA
MDKLENMESTMALRKKVDDKFKQLEEDFDAKMEANNQKWIW